MKYLVLFLAVFRVMAGPGDVPDIPEEFGGYRFVTEEELVHVEGEKEGVKLILGPVPKGFFEKHNGGPWKQLEALLKRAFSFTEEEFKAFSQENPEIIEFLKNLVESPIPTTLACKEEGGGVLPLSSESSTFLSKIYDHPALEEFREGWNEVNEGILNFHAKRHELPNHEFKAELEGEAFTVSFFDTRYNGFPPFVVRSVRSPDEFWRGETGVPGFSASLLTVNNNYFNSTSNYRFVMGILPNPCAYILSAERDLYTITAYNLGIRRSIGFVNDLLNLTHRVLRDQMPENLSELNEKFAAKDKEGNSLYVVKDEKCRELVPQMKSSENLKSDNSCEYNEVFLLSDSLLPCDLNKKYKPTQQFCWVMNPIDYYNFILFLFEEKFFIDGELKEYSEVFTKKIKKDFSTMLKSDLPIYLIKWPTHEGREIRDQSGNLLDLDMPFKEISEFMKTYQDGKYLLESV